MIARDAIQNVCAGRLDRIAEFYDEEFVDYVNGMVFRGHDEGRESLAFYIDSDAVTRPLLMHAAQQAHGVEGEGQRRARVGGDGERERDEAEEAKSTKSS